MTKPIKSIEEVIEKHKEDQMKKGCGNPCCGEPYVDNELLSQTIKDYIHKDSVGGLDEENLVKVVSKAFYDNGYGGSNTVCPECHIDDFVHVEWCSLADKPLDIVIAKAISSKFSKPKGRELDTDRIWDIVHENRLLQNDEGMIEIEFHLYNRHLENLCEILSTFSKPEIVYPERKECLSPIENCFSFLSKNEKHGLCDNCKFNKALDEVKRLNNGGSDE